MARREHERKVEERMARAGLLEGKVMSPAISADYKGSRGTISFQTTRERRRLR
jgi:hypothetical protein